MVHARPTPQVGNRLGVAALIGLLWLFASVCNYGKAFHIDDTAHLEIARWIAEHPGHPMSGWLHWGDDLEPIHHTNQPHLYFYLMALWAQVFGWQERAMQALMAGFTLWAIWTFHRLATRLAPDWALLATALFALCPALVVGQNSMVDIPLLAMWLACFLAMLAGADRNAHGYAGAALLCAAALLTKYTSIVLLPALALSMLLTRRWRAAGWLVVPVLALAAWSAFNLSDYGGIHLLGRQADPHSLVKSGDAAIAWVLALGAIAPFAPLVLAAQGARATGRALRALWSALAFLSALGPALLLLGWLGRSMLLSEDRIYPLLKLSFAAGGLGLLAAAVLAGWRQARIPAQHATALLLCYWLLSSLLFIIALAPFVATRHVVLALPPLLLLIARDTPRALPISALGTPGPSAKWPVALALVTSLAVCSVLAIGDRWHAQIYRHYPAQIRATLPPASTVWFTGHWGWQWYAGEAGLRQLSAHCDQPGIGDFIVSPTSVSRSPVPPGLDLQLASSFSIARAHWVQRWVSRDAGFYASTRWRLPWSYTEAPIDVIQVWQVVDRHQIESPGPRNSAACAYSRDRSWPRIRQ